MPKLTSALLNQSYKVVKLGVFHRGREIAVESVISLTEAQADLHGDKVTLITDDEPIETDLETGLEDSSDWTLYDDDLN